MMAGCDTMCVFLLVLAVGFVQCRSVETPCDVAQYFDGGTGRCEYCSDICEHADIKGTQRACQIECADYLAAQICGAEEYYNKHTSQCSPCSLLCQPHDVPENDAQCQTLCPDYKVQADSTTREPSTSDDVSQNTDSSDMSKLLTTIVLPVLVSILCLFVVATLIVFCLCRVPTSATANVKYTPAPEAELGLDGDALPAPIEQLRYPQTETQPFVCSELAATGT